MMALRGNQRHNCLVVGSEREAATYCIVSLQQWPHAKSKMRVPTPEDWEGEGLAEG